MRLLPFMMGLVSGEVALMLGNAKRQAVFLAIIAFFALIAVSFGLVAVDMALAAVLGALYASLIMAGGALVLCLLVFIIMKIVMARAHRQAAKRREAATAYATAAATFMPFLLRSKSVLAVGIPLAALAGFLLVPRRSRRSDD